jgi:hypothetical protein
LSTLLYWFTGVKAGFLGLLEQFAEQVEQSCVHSSLASLWIFSSDILLKLLWLR